MSTIKQLRSVRIGPVAAFDLIGTIAISLGWSKYTGQNKASSLLMWFLIGDLTHRATDTVTPGTEIVDSMNL
jgi:hypothetical protein